MNAKPNTWTIAYRKPRANRFQRVTNWHGTWAQACELAHDFAEANPELQVFYVPTAASEADGTNPEDAGNILVDSGKRVRMIDNGELSGDVLDYALGLLMGDAVKEDAAITEAHLGQAEDAGMTIPAYLACLKGHTSKGEIFLSGLWKAPISEMTKVVVFDGGARYGVTAGTAAYYTGEVQDMPDGEISKCVHCKSTTLLPESEEIDSPEKELDSIDAFLIEAERILTDLSARALKAENEAWDRGTWDAECWTGAAKGMVSARENVQWLQAYRKHNA